MTTARRVLKRLQSGPATKAELALSGVPDKTVERTLIRMTRRGEIAVVGKRPPRGGRPPYIYGVA